MTNLEAATATHLYLVRHGETDYNRRSIVQGRGVDVPLNAVGIHQARALGERAVELNLDVVYASTLLRARQTAQTVTQMNRDVPLIFLRDLEEMSWGSYEGMHVNDELRLVFDKLKEQWGLGNYAFSVGEGESALDVQQRGLNALFYILGNHQGKRVMIVAHGRLLRILIASILKEFGLQKMEEIKHANAGINYITHTEKGFEMQFLDNTDHLASVGAMN